MWNGGASDEDVAALLAKQQREEWEKGFKRTGGSGRRVGDEEMGLGTGPKQEKSMRR